MFSETVLRLNYVISYQLYVLGDRLKNDYSIKALYLRKKLAFSKPVEFDKRILTNKTSRSSVLKGKQLEQIITKSDYLYENGSYKESLQMLNQCNDQKNSQILWRQGRAAYYYAMDENNKATKKAIISGALQKLNNALENDENIYTIHVWLSVFLLRHVEVNGISTSTLHNIKKAQLHMHRAIELSPNEPLPWFTLAHFMFHVAELPWLQRKLILSCLDIPLKTKFEEALEYFERAERLKPDFCSTNQLMIAKCHVALKNFNEAEKYLKKLINMNIRNYDDKHSKEEADKILLNIKKQRANANH